VNHGARQISLVRGQSFREVCYFRRLTARGLQSLQPLTMMRFAAALGPITEYCRFAEDIARPATSEDAIRWYIAIE
jgi:hypothetical protein